MPHRRPNSARVHTARHDLRNQLGEILGFSELLADEAGDLSQTALAAEFAALARATSAILERLNHTLTLEQLQARPQFADEFARLVLEFSKATAATAADLLARCELLDGQPFTEDLARIRRSAIRLAEIAPVLLAEMFDHEAASLAELEQLSGAPALATDAPAAAPRPVTAIIARADSHDTVLLHAPSSARPALTGTVLVVDDNESNRAVLARRLGRQGFTVELAEHGRRALEMLRQHSFDIVLLDILMPEMDGHQVLTALKADESLRHIPVIMISGLDDLETLVRCIEGGAEDYLTKPFDPVLLRARIGACLDKKRLRDREREHLALIDEQRRRADELLHVILPRTIAIELKDTNAVKPRQHDNVAVLFSDVVGFTAYCEKHPTDEVMANLQSLVHAFEEIAARHGLEKIKTIGDAFMATAGLLEAAENPALSCVRAGLEMVQAARALPCGWEVHVGVHSGPVISGVVGKRKYLFDVWGDTVNTASRIANLAGAGAVYVSEATWQQVRSACAGDSCGRFQIKGKGEREVFQIHSVTPL